MKKSIIALIPLRGGSKSIPLKNIKPFAGHPLCYWTIKAAQDCSLIDEVWVSTDHPQIKDICLSLGTKVIDRPAELATDTASTESVMLHFMQNLDFDILVTLQATSPFTTSLDLDEAIKLFKQRKYDSLLSAVSWKRFFWNTNNEPVNYDPYNRPRRQEFEGWLMENGAFYLTKRQILEKYQNRLGGRIGIYTMDPQSSVEIDELEDWIVAEHLFQKKTDK